jgi:hypothetical protein
MTFDKVSLYERAIFSHSIVDGWSTSVSSIFNHNHRSVFIQFKKLNIDILCERIDSSHKYSNSTAI